jgi:hypothetical protein
VPSIEPSLTVVSATRLAIDGCSHSRHATRAITIPVVLHGAPQHSQYHRHKSHVVLHKEVQRLTSQHLLRAHEETKYKTSIQQPSSHPRCSGHEAAQQQVAAHVWSILGSQKNAPKLQCSVITAAGRSSSRCRCDCFGLLDRLRLCIGTQGDRRATPPDATQLPSNCASRFAWERRVLPCSGPRPAVNTTNSHLMSELGYSEHQSADVLKCYPWQLSIPPAQRTTSQLYALLSSSDTSNVRFDVCHVSTTAMPAFGNAGLSCF